MAHGATQVFIATLDRAVPFDIFAFYRGQHRYVGVDTLALSAAETGAVLETLRPGFEAGALTPYEIEPDFVFPLSRAEEAYRIVLGGAPQRVLLEMGRVNVTRLADAPAYEAPGHFDMRMLRLQGREAGPAESLWLGLSWLLPGGHTTLDASPVEKHYVVVEGELDDHRGARRPAGGSDTRPPRFLPHRAGRGAAARKPDEPAGGRGAGHALRATVRRATLNHPHTPTNGDTIDPPPQRHRPG